MKPCKTVCKPGKVCNPKTGRCINDPDKDKDASSKTPQQTLVCPKKLHLDDDEFMASLKKSLKAYYKYGERSNEKLKILHSYISCALKHTFTKYHMPDVVIRSLPMREDRVVGEFYDKNVDITIRHNSHPYGLVSVKFIMSNYKQNENNYFENLIGESLNLKAKNKYRLFWFILVTFREIPYFKNNHFLQTLQKFDKTKYAALADNKNNTPLLPDNISITLINNNDTFMHPSSIPDMSDTDVDEYVDKLVKPKGFLSVSDQLNFFRNLEVFTLKTIANIVNSSSDYGRS